MIVIKDIDHFAQKYRAFSALMGAVVLSGPILDGQGGLKLSHKPGFKFGVSVYATNNFKKEQPGLTLLVREACARGSAQDDSGWQAVSLEDAAKNKRGKRTAPIILHGKDETVQVQGASKKCRLMTGGAFTTWVAKLYIDHQASAWIKGSNP